MHSSVVHPQGSNQEDVRNDRGVFSGNLETRNWEIELERGKAAWKPRRFSFLPEVLQNVLPHEDDKEVVEATPSADMKQLLQDKLQKESDDLNLPYVKRPRQRRHLIWRIISGTYFTEPKSVNWTTMFNLANTGDIFLQRHQQNFDTSGNIAVPPEVLLGMGTTLNGAYQSKTRNVQCWNHVGVIVVLKDQSKHLLSCGKTGIELSPLSDLLARLGRRKNSCALRRVKFDTEGKREEVVSKLLQLGDMVLRGGGDWTQLMAGAADRKSNQSATTDADNTEVVKADGKEEKDAKQTDVDDSAALEFAHSIVKEMLIRVENAGSQISLEQIAAAVGEFYIHCQDKEIEAAALAEDLKKEHNGAIQQIHSSIQNNEPAHRDRSAYYLSYEEARQALNDLLSLDPSPHKQDVEQTVTDESLMNRANNGQTSPRSQQQEKALPDDIGSQLLSRAGIRSTTEKIYVNDYTSALVLWHTRHVPPDVDLSSLITAEFVVVFLSRLGLIRQSLSNLECFYPSSFQTYVRPPAFSCFTNRKKRIKTVDEAIVYFSNLHGRVNCHVSILTDERWKGMKLEREVVHW